MKPKQRTDTNPISVESLESRTLFAVTPQVVGYLPDYEFSHFSSIDLGALTTINYFSVTANSSGSLGTTSASGYSFSQLQTVVAAAHAAPSRVSVSIVIDPGSQFQNIASSSTATNTFITNILAFCSTYHLDGIDLDYEPGNGSLTQAQINTWGSFLGTLHAQTSAHGLILSEAVQVSPPYIIPKADISDIDRYNVMDYALDYNSSAPYAESISYLTGWANYGVPKADLIMGLPFYGSSGTSWNNSAAETYAQIVGAYEAANGGATPNPSLDTLTINGTTWGFNGVTTVENKANYVLQNGYGGTMIWELGQDSFTSGKYNSTSLLPAIKSVYAAASETWTGAVSNAWNNAGNWNFGAIPISTTNVIINSGTVIATSPFSVASLVLNGGILEMSGATASTLGSLAINNGAALDLGTSILQINYGSATDPIATIRSYLGSGFNSGAWNGAGIMSSAAAATSASYGLGYADSADPGNPASLASGQIEIMYTLLGDANLDRAVNGSDYAILAANFNQAVSGWDAGDFNYDGAANGADFAALAANFNQGVNIAAVSNDQTVAIVANTSAAVTSPSQTTITTATPTTSQHAAKNKHARKDK